MTGLVRWSRRGDEDWYAEVQKCVRIDNKINIIFANYDDKFEGQVSFDALKGKHEANGRWITNPKSSEGFSVIVQGTLIKFVGEVVFEGTWDEKDGDPWNFYVEAAVD